MSYSTVKIITTKGKFKEIAELRNAHGFAPFIWSAISKKYLGDEFYWIRDEGETLWPLWKDKRLPYHWRVALLITFDYAIIEFPKFKEAAQCLRKFVEDNPPGNRVCHLVTIANILENWKEKCKGMCFYATSVGDDLWRIWDEKRDTYHDYNFKKDKRHFYVFEEINRVEANRGNDV